MLRQSGLVVLFTDSLFTFEGRLRHKHRTEHAALTFLSVSQDKLQHGNRDILPATTLRIASAREISHSFFSDGLV